MELATLGYLIPSFDQGALLLKDTAGEVFRLSWEQDRTEEGASQDRRRGLPSGEYTVIGLRIRSKDQRGHQWDLSASHPELRALSVKAGAELPVKWEETIRIRYRLSPKMLGFDMTLGQKAGVTLYRDGERIRMAYELLDDGDEVRLEGPLTYG